MMINRIFVSITDFIYDLALRIIPLALLGLLTLASFWFLKKNIQEELPVPPRVKLHQPDYIFTNAKLTVLNPDGSTKYRLLGQEFKHYEDNAAIDILLPKLRLFNPKTPALTVSANTGHVTGDLDIVELFKNADVSRPAEFNPRGIVINPHLHLQSNYLKIFVNDDRMMTHLPIRIERGDSVMTASQGAMYDNVDQAISMYGDVKGSIAPSENSKKLLP
jgi:lipopolysaccharide export system protein LptC